MDNNGTPYDQTLLESVSAEPVLRGDVDLDHSDGEPVLSCENAQATLRILLKTVPAVPKVTMINKAISHRLEISGNRTPWSQIWFGQFTLLA